MKSSNRVIEVGKCFYTIEEFIAKFYNCSYVMFNNISFREEYWNDLTIRQNHIIDLLYIRPVAIIRISSIKIKP